MRDPFAFDEKDRPVGVHIHDDVVSVKLADGRIISNPLAWHPWLTAATVEQQAQVEFHAFSVDWPKLDEGLDIQGMLFGVRPRFPQTADNR
ncbi:MAG: DUF2442 domain-containing protein [Chitinophagaceae bacterium]|nr:DUF2442 domain-containing protein [Anaerolineae bacterium]